MITYRRRNITLKNNEVLDYVSFVGKTIGVFCISFLDINL